MSGKKNGGKWKYIQFNSGSHKTTNRKHDKPQANSSNTRKILHKVILSINNLSKMIQVFWSFLWHY